MRRAYLLGGLAFGAAAVVWSCGLDDTAVISLDQDASTSDGSTLDGAVEDSGGDANPQGDGGGGDSGFDAGPCAPSDLRRCDDDGGCGSANEVCTPPLDGTGWTVVNLTDPASACSAGYSAPKDLVAINDGGPSACVCSCASGAAPSCDNDVVELGTGGGACTNSEQAIQMTNGCSALSLNVGVDTGYSGMVGVSSECTGLTDASFPDPDAGAVRTCDLNSDAGTLCENHRSCVPKPASGKICIASTTATSCPAGFARVDVAASYSDSRSCPPCGCGWTNDGCANPVVALHNVGNCGGSATTVNAACTTVNGLFASIGLTGNAPATPPACAVNDAGALDGGVGITSPEIVCCSN